MSVPVDPIQRFRELYARASDDAPFDPAAVVLATATRDGRPSARVVLLRRVDELGFGFYTNYESRKGRELRENPWAALCCYWPWLDEQVRIEGPVSVAPPEDSDDYFASRPRGSRIGAWASRQSEPLPSRAELEARYEALEREYEGRDIPRPPFWGGYRLRPERIEFWRAGRYRLHDRQLYVREGSGWRTETLYP
ncbi:MAG TPA: pyridoxamine 5'-phosphate oxidase [Vicinamibacterales bacterium]